MLLGDIAENQQICGFVAALLGREEKPKPVLCLKLKFKGLVLFPKSGLVVVILCTAKHAFDILRKPRRSHTEKRLESADNLGGHKVASPQSDTDLVFLLRQLLQKKPFGHRKIRLLFFDPAPSARDISEQNHRRHNFDTADNHQNIIAAEQRY